MIGPGRIIKAAQLAAVDECATLPNVTLTSLPTLMPRETLAALDLLERETQLAHAKLAERRVADEQETQAQRKLAIEEGRKQGYADFVNQLLRVKALEANLEKATQERVMSLARLLAERLLDKALELSPGLIQDLANTALSEVRGARKVQLFVSPDDLPYIAPELARMAIPAASLLVSSDTELAPGQLRVVTELGTFEANIGLRLDALSRALRAGGPA